MTKRSQYRTMAVFAILVSLFLWQAKPPSSSAAAKASGGISSRSTSGPLAPAPASFADVAARAMPAVVNISTIQTLRSPPHPDPFGEEDPLEEFFRRFFGERAPPRERQSLGSGFIISADGYIVTNYHVVADAEQISVRLGQPHSEEYEGKVVGVDELTDLALIKVAARRPLPTIPWGSSASLRVGDWVIAIGNPFGLDQTVTAGIVSGKGRVIGAGPYDDFIQTDASINPGNSGGPLLNLRGEVVGVNSAILSRAGGSIGIGFAVPIDLAKSVIEQLKRSGRVIRGWLGVSVQSVTPEIARLFGLDKPRGALIGDVATGGPADKAGIRRGDIVTSFDGISIKEAADLPALVARMKVGARVKVGVIRDAQERSFTITIGELPSRPTGTQPSDRREDAWGMTVTNISPEMVRRFRFKQGQEGVVVIAVERASSAACAGVQVGDVIEEVSRQAIRSVKDYDKAMAEAKDSDQVLLLTRRGDFSSYLVLRKRG